MVDYIHVSNGDGIPVTAIVTTDRGVGSTQLIVDSVLNWATHGIGMSGTLDPTNGEITEKTVFRYHLDGSIITIEKFTAGYIDIGNTKDQIVVLKPTTEWGNAVADRVNEIEVGATWHSGAGAPSDSLGNDGDYYLNTTNSDIYTKTAGTWGGSILNIKGATGATGSAGTNGTNGAAGAVIRNGSGSPSNGLGIDGDYYINITTSDVYFKASGAYTIVVNIKGATGSTGSTGAAGKGVTSIVKTDTVGLVDTYTITYSDATTSTFTVTNGAAGSNGTNGTNGTNGLGVPAGGATNQLLTKNSSADNDTSWKDAPVSLPSQTGANGKYLTTNGSAASWNTLPNLANQVYDQLMSGTINGVNTVFTTASNFASILVFKNGVTLHVGDDYTITGANQITMVSAPLTGSKLTCLYNTASTVMIQGSNSLKSDEIPAGLVNSSNTSYTTSVPYIANSLEVFINGIKQQRGVHFAETTPASGIFTMSDAPLTGDNVLVVYQFVASVSGNADTLDSFHASATPTANMIMPLDSSAKFPANLLKFSGCRVYKSAVQALTSGAYQYATFDTESYDTDNYHSTVTNTTRLTIPTTGYYRVSWHVAWAQGAGYTDCWFIINGATGGRYAGQSCPNNTAGASVETNGSTTLKLNANDYIELMPYQTSGGNLNIWSGDSGTYFTIEKVGE